MSAIVLLDSRSPRNRPTREGFLMECSKCGKALDAKEGGAWRAAISGSVLGDEISDIYYFCESCGVYTMLVCYETFLGEDEISIRGPISKEEGDEQVELIRQCSTPWDKSCRCAAHVAYFRGTLD